MVGNTANLYFFVLMVVRSALLYSSIFLCIRFNKNIMGRRNPFNFIIYIMLGSLIAIAITTENSVWPFLGIIVFILLFNAFVAYSLARFPLLEKLLKGPSIVIIRDGKVNWSLVKDHYITRSELREELQEQLKTDDFSVVKYAYLASDGNINFVMKKTPKKQQ